jgi:hypothetical protein
MQRAQQEFAFQQAHEQMVAQAAQLQLQGGPVQPRHLGPSEMKRKTDAKK